MNEAYYIKVVVVFVLIVVFLAGVYLFVSRFSFPFKVNGKGEISIKEVKYLGKNRMFVLLKVKNSEILLSLDERGVTKIKEWTDEKDINPSDS